MATRVTQIFNTVIKPHVPLIRFRKGAPLSPHIEVPVSSAPLAAQPVVQQEPTPVVSQPTGKLQSVVQSHEWWDTPFKFKRRHIGDVEMDLINSGGSDKLYC